MGRNEADWAALGLTGNPFENVLPGEHLDWVDVPAPVRAALAHRPFVVELVGEKGAGKTTTLRWYAGHHADARYAYCAGADLPPLPWEGAQVLCLDEANNLSRDALEAVAREARTRGVSLLVSTHWTLAEALGRVQSFALGRFTALSWVDKRVAAASLTGRARFDFDAVAHALFPRVSRVNYALLRVLYELAENLARGIEAHDALDDALARAREDETVAPFLQP
ncbi:MAG: hypothetical protein AB1730_12715 [Myxococcota bacterium]